MSQNYNDNNNNFMGNQDQYNQHSKYQTHFNNTESKVKKTPNRRYWEEKDVNELKKYIHKSPKEINFEKLAERFGRTPSAVKTKLNSIKKGKFGGKSRADKMMQRDQLIINNVTSLLNQFYIKIENLLNGRSNNHQYSPSKQTYSGPSKQTYSGPSKQNYSGYQ